ncbi:MAG: hypothetical protein WC989_01215 [Micavibrio sp.]
MRKLMTGACALGLIGIAACTSGPLTPTLQLTFENYQTMPLQVRNVTVQEAYIAADDPDNVASQFVLPPAEAVKRYANKRFSAQGIGDGHLTFVIEDARVHMRQIEQNNRVLSWAGVGKEDEYRVLLQVSITPQPHGTTRVSPSKVRMDRTIVMPSSITLAEREMRQIQFLEKMIADLDAQVQQVLSSVPSIR